ncbi:MAG: hypothetical protein EAZ20_15725 [Bacteroidetes bacterium]|nr:MAG: hypothetical protein EAZ20_15725 [Bacteroidota bacterium]
MLILIPLLVIIPFVGLILGLFASSKIEKQIGFLALFMTTLHIILTPITIIYWFFVGNFNIKELVLYRSNDYEFFIDFYFDHVTAVYLWTGSLLTFMVTIYSKYYLHLEKGYKRFFNSMFLFFLGYNIVVLSGNFETMFIGWEILGISSFLLIAFYRDRYLPIKNAMKVFSIYRIGDVGLILTMWLSHHLWHENVTFAKMKNLDIVIHHLQDHTLLGTSISIFILLAAVVKSAQLPFSSWLARAMEGPSPSSAIFYGSLSVHMGGFLLIRTFPFWENQILVRVLVGALGLATAFISNYIARVQPSIKGQIAYSSSSQIGLIFLEIALGLEYLALFHFMGNAFLRTYQLLVAPSSVAYLIKEQFYTYNEETKPYKDTFYRKISNSFYVLSIKEWYLDYFMYRFLWQPLKWIGKKFHFVGNPFILLILLLIYIISRILLHNKISFLPIIEAQLPIIYSLFGFIFILRSFSERYNVFLAWGLIVMSHLWIDLSISFNQKFTLDHTLLYLSGIFFSGLIGFICLLSLRRKKELLDMTNFHGYAENHKKTNFIFLLATLGLAGFPITTAFLGKDLVFTHIEADQILITFITSVCFVVDGIATLRIYTRLFLGEYKKIE